MTLVVQLIVRYQLPIFVAIGALGALYVLLYLRAHDRLTRTPFGLEREVWVGHQNSALIMLTLLVILAATLYAANVVVIPAIEDARAAGTPAVEPSATPSPVAASDNIVVDSSGCQNPHATLSAPKNGERIAGAYEVHGSADIPNLAFYKFEISGAGTNGDWLSLGVGTAPVTNGKLGSFDATAREPGHYAFRLVVLDNSGNSPPPCVITVTIVGLGPTPPSLPTGAAATATATPKP
jgi:hypothetical protein